MTWKETKYWDKKIRRSFGFLGNTIWFSVDTATRKGKMVNRADYDEGVAAGLMEYLRDNEAVFVATERSIVEWQEKYPYVMGDTFESCRLEIPLDELASMKGYLVVRCCMWNLNGAPHLKFKHVERVHDPLAIAALFADD